MAAILNSFTRGKIYMMHGLWSERTHKPAEGKKDQHEDDVQSKNVQVAFLSMEDFIGHSTRGESIDHGQEQCLVKLIQH